MVQGKKVDIDEKTLYNLYLIKGLSSREIAAIYNCHKSVILKRLKEYKILPRPNVGDTKQFSIENVAKLYGYSTSTIKKTKDRIGKTFHWLKIISLHKRFDNQAKYVYYNCICKCGKEKVVSWRHLNNGSTKSCGCYKRNRTGYKCVTGTFFSKINFRAKQKNLDIDITPKYIYELYIKQNKKCALSYQDIFFPTEGNKTTSNTVSVDRIDSSKGYIKGNVHLVKQSINQSKWNYTLEEYTRDCELVTKHKNRKKEEEYEQDW